MIVPPRRVAFFTDSFHEVNGVGLTSRQFEDFARRRGLPFFSYHGGPETRSWADGSVVRYEVQRGGLSLALDADLRFDVSFLRHKGMAREALRQFRPDLVHITGPGDCGMMGALVAWDLKLPIAASWHTNVHEFLERRIRRQFAWLPETATGRIAAGAREGSLSTTLQLYKPARVLFAPNRELVAMLERRTGRPCYLMQRGVDTRLFDPARRDRTDDVVVLGFVGRLFPEKNVQFLKQVEEGLVARGLMNYRFLIVGHGSEDAWLQQNLARAELPGLLQGEALAGAYANMDVFVFPSHTDTFGNVVQEALASGVPCVVTGSGGPKFIVKPGLTGLVGETDADFVNAVARLVEDSKLRAEMSAAARRQALEASWDSVFEKVYQAYEEQIFDQSKDAAVSARK